MNLTSLSILLQNNDSEAEKGETCGRTSSLPALQISIFFLLLSILVGILFGNTLVVIAIAMIRRLWTSQNIMLVSLAVSDWLVGAVVIPLTLLTEQRIIVGHTCDAIFFFENLLCSSSIFNLTAIAVDRYMLLTRPFTYIYRRTRVRVAKSIILVWLLSCFVTIPLVFSRKLFHMANRRGSVLQWGDVIFELAATIVAFFLPLLIMLVLYGRIFSLAHSMSTKVQRCQSQPVDHMEIGEVDTEVTQELRTLHQQQQHEPQKPQPTSLKYQPKTGLIEADLKAIRTLGIIMGVFTICWLPYYTVLFMRPIYHAFDLQLDVKENKVKALQWLGYFNSLLNPFVYSVFHRDLRYPIQHLLRCRCSSLRQRMREKYKKEQFGIKATSFLSKKTNVTN